MKAYIICFIFSVFFAIVAEINIKKKKKAFGIICLIFSLLIVCIIAGVRSRTVGADVNVYPAILYNLFVNENYSFFMAESYAKIEPLFSLLIMIATLFKDFNIMLFFIEVACALPIYIYAYKNKEEYSITFIILIFLLTMYARSFNLMRQFIAISTILLSTYYFKKKKYKITAILFIMAVLTHYSAIVGVVIYSIIHIIYDFKRESSRKFFLLAVIGGILIFIIGIDKMLLLLPTKYAGYLESRYAVSTFSVSSLIKKFFWIIISLTMIYKTKKDNKIHNLLLECFVFLIIDVLMYFLSFKVGTFGRLGNYFLYIAYFEMIPKISKVFKQKVIINIIVFIILVFFWYNMTIVNYMSDRTYPYTSDIVKVLNDKEKSEYTYY